MSCSIDSDSFHGTKKGQPRKYVRKAYEKSKQLRQKRNIPQSHPERYTLAMIADLESRVNLGVPADMRIKWLLTLKQMYVYFERRR